MPLDMENLQLIAQKQQESIAMLLEKLSMNMSIKTESSNPPEPKPSPESLIQQASEFLFDPDSELTFESWFQKCEDIFRVDLAHVPDHSYENYVFYSSEKVRGHFLRRNSPYSFEIIW